MASKTVVIWILVLRVVTLLALAASAVVMGTNNVKYIDGSKFSFADLRAYRYVLAVACVGCVYSLLQLPFSIFYVAAGEKKWIKTSCLPMFDFFCDKVMCWVLASGVGLGFGITFELRRDLHKEFSAIKKLGFINVELEDEESKLFQVLDTGYIASGILLAGFLTMAITSVLTSVGRSGK